MPSTNSRIIEGNSRVFLPRAAAFDLLAETGNGNVANHLRRDQHDSEKARKIKMSVGSAPRSEINIRAIHGDIEIAAAKTD